ncbi:MAG: hypothetical protein GX456_11050 [Verrucomicrobia bacterium]|nr:hypothetical protein [Verrucomicrobiota bacterium]
MQSVSLTSEERQVVLDYATRLDKRSRHWRVLRWLSVGCFVFGLVLLLAVDRLSTKMRSTMELPPAAVEGFESSLQLVVAHGDAQIAALRAEMYLVIRVLIAAGIGTALFVYAVSEWRRDRRDRLVVRLLRSVASDETGEKDKS